MIAACQRETRHRLFSDVLGLFGMFLSGGSLQADHMLVFFHQATAKIYAAIRVQVTFLGFALSLISALVCMVSTEAFNGPDSTGQPACIDAAGGYNSYVSWLTDKRMIVPAYCAKGLARLSSGCKTRT